MSEYLLVRYYSDCGPTIVSTFKYYRDAIVYKRGLENPSLYTVMSESGYQDKSREWHRYHFTKKEIPTMNYETPTITTNPPRQSH